ncbi:DNA ligase LigA-related protein [Proteus mirabilis]|uniref:DNA ligase LigA-related protein n=1 Tax=Proteus mirabilis TaxID=584 RepID=UPI0034D43B2A
MELILQCSLDNNGTSLQCSYYEVADAELFADDVLEQIIQRVKNKDVTLPSLVHSFINDINNSERELVSIANIHRFDNPKEGQSWMDEQINKYLGESCPRTCANVDHIARRIRKLRAMILINSSIYYDLNDSIITDHDWDRIAYSLVALQTKYPQLVDKINYFDKEFADFDGSTGYNLPYRTSMIFGIAQRILNHHYELKGITHE